MYLQCRNRCLQTFDCKCNQSESGSVCWTLTSFSAPLTPGQRGERTGGEGREEGRGGGGEERGSSFKKIKHFEKPTSCCGVRPTFLHHFLLQTSGNDQRSEWKEGAGVVRALSSETAHSASAKQNPAARCCLSTLSSFSPSWVVFVFCFKRRGSLLHAEFGMIFSNLCNGEGFKKAFNSLSGWLSSAESLAVYQQ